MDPNLIAALLVVPAVLAGVVALDHDGLRPTRTWILRAHAASAVVAVAALLGGLVPAFANGLSVSGPRAVALLSAAELGIAYALVVAVWVVRTALEASPVVRSGER